MPFSHALARLAWAALAAVLAALAAPAAAQVPLVAAAADLKFALADAATEYKRTTGRDVRLAFGSSGAFTQQIENGAPFEIFMSADEAYVGRLAAKGLARDAGVLYAVGRLVLFVPHGSPLKADPTLADLRAAATDGRLKRFAIANPDHAPYGRAAREALQAVGAWKSLGPMLVLGENAAQAMQFAAGGDAQGGIVPYTLAMAPEVAKRGTAVPLPDALHGPLRQRMALLQPAGAEAAAFYRWLQTPAARAIFVRHGLALPGEH